MTSVYVTHDRDEAFAMADRLMFMNSGKVVQTGTPEEVFDDPGDECVARSLGFKNIMPGVVRRRGEVAEIECAVGTLTLSQQSTLEGENTLLIKENGIAVSQATNDGPPEMNALSGTIVERVFRGGEYELKVLVGEGSLLCPTPVDRSAALRPGQQVSIVVDPGALKLLKSA